MARLDRRKLLLLGAGAAGALGIGWLASPVRSRLVASHAQAAPPGSYRLSGWLTIDAADSVTVCVPKMEMGQGIATGLAMLLAEELDVEWSRVGVTPAFGDPIYNNPELLSRLSTALDPKLDGRLLRPAAEHVLRKIAREVPGLALTGASTSIVDHWDSMREAGASARAMLMQAAARRWGVSVDECTTDKGHVLHASRGRLAYGQLAEEASKLSIPRAVTLKPSSGYRFIGKAIPRLETAVRETGTARYGSDIQQPGQLYACMKMCPVLGGTVRSFDLARAQTSGALAFVQVAAQPGGLGSVGSSAAGVAVIAPTPHAAMLAADALEVTWDEGSGASLSSESIVAELRQAVASDDTSVLYQWGDVDTHLGRGAARIQAAYEVPFLAHAAMEPLNCTVRVDSEQVEVWVGCQGPGIVQNAVAKALEVKPETVRVHPLAMGGSFGRRTMTDFAVQAALVARAMPGRPVQLLWTREQDIAHDFFRAPFVASCQATLDDEGLVSAWDLRLAGTSLGQPALLSPSREGTVTTPYAVPHMRIRHALRESAVPTGIWRSVAHSHNAYFMESFVDELAGAARMDPVAYRQRLLGSNRRHRHVLDAVAALSNWSSPLPLTTDGQPQSRGIALWESFGSVVAQVARVSVGPRREIRVHEVSCVVDCGVAVHPGLVRQQIEGGIVYGLTAALHGRIDIEAGRVVQSNFHDYRALRMHECPVVTTHILQSSEPPGGIGEVATPPIAPAVANALFSLTGQRLRTLPLTLR